MHKTEILVVGLCTISVAILLFGIYQIFASEFVYDPQFGHFRDSAGHIYYQDYDGAMITSDEYLDRITWCLDTYKSGTLYDVGIFIHSDCTKGYKTMKEGFYHKYIQHLTEVEKQKK